MKKITFSLVASIVLVTSVFGQPYSGALPGDPGYSITLWNGDWDFSSPNFTLQCGDPDPFKSLVVIYPNVSPTGNHDTRTKFVVQEQDAWTGSITNIVMSSWEVNGEVESESHVTSSTVVETWPFMEFKAEKRYWVYIEQQKKVACIWWNSPNDGFTQSFYVRPCTNGCFDSGDLILGDLNSAPVNQVAGLYNPKYETDNKIFSSTHLNTSEELILDAGVSIHLLPGFKAEYGSKFAAWIDGCGGLRSSQITEEVTIDEQNQQRKEAIAKQMIPTLMTLEEANVYPNPSNGEFKIRFEGLNNDAKCSIVNLQGQVMNVLFDSNRTNEISFDLSGESPGMYILSVEQNGQSFRKKIVLQ